MINRALFSRNIGIRLAQLIGGLAVTAFAIHNSALDASVIIKPVAPGISLTEEIDSNPPEIIHELTVNPAVPGTHFESIPGQDTLTGPTGDIHNGRDEVRQIALRHGAVAAINGDYFPFTGDPLGAALWNGNLYSEPYPGRCAMGIEADGKTVLFDILSFAGELQTQQGQITPITGVDRMVSATDNTDLVVFTPTFGPRTGIRPGCVEVLLTGINLPLRPSKLEVGTISAVNTNVSIGSNIPSNGAILAALPGGPAAAFLTANCKVGEQAEFVCAIAPSGSIDDAVRLAALPRDPNDYPVIPANYPDTAAYQWATMSEIIGGGPHLIVNGQIAVDGEDEGFQDSFINGPNPRTAVGVTADGKILMVTVDGRQALSRGASLQEIAQIMLRLGAVNAMNLDGGGSTTMAVDGLLMNSIAATGVERPVANALCVFSSADPAQQSPSTQGSTSSVASSPPVAAVDPPQSTFSIAGLSGPTTVGQTETAYIVNGGKEIPGTSPDILWGGSIGNGIAYLDQSGRLTALQPGQGSVTAYYKGNMLQTPITVNQAPGVTGATLITADFVSVPAKRPHQSTVIIGAFTPDGAPVPKTPLHISVVGGSTLTSNVTTDIDGYAQTTIAWHGTSGSITITSPGLNSVDLNQP